jgi:hypothetical protein
MIILKNSFVDINVDMYSYNYWSGVINERFYWIYENNRIIVKSREL